MALTNGQEKQALAATIEKIADAARGAVDGWDFKMYIFGTLFYRYLSEYIAAYINKNEWDAGRLSCQCGAFVQLTGKLLRNIKIRYDINI